MGEMQCRENEKPMLCRCQKKGDRAQVTQSTCPHAPTRSAPPKGAWHSEARIAATDAYTFKSLLNKTARPLGHTVIRDTTEKSTYVRGVRLGFGDRYGGGFGRRKARASTLIHRSERKLVYVKS